jgi:hypothetical protein
MVKLFYLSFDVRTIVPLSTEMLIGHPRVVKSEHKIKKSCYDEIENYFTTVILEKPQPFLVTFPTFGGMPEKEILHTPYMNARLIILLPDGKKNLSVAIGTHNTISINETLFIIYDDFIKKTYDLLSILDQHEIAKDLISYYKSL